MNEHLTKTLENLKENAAYSSLELNMMVEVGIRQIRLFVGIPSAINVLDLYHTKQRQAHVGLMLEIDEIFKLFRE